MSEARRGRASTRPVHYIVDSDEEAAIEEFGSEAKPSSDLDDNDAFSATRSISPLSSPLLKKSSGKRKLGTASARSSARGGGGGSTPKPIKSINDILMSKKPRTVSEKGHSASRHSVEPVKACLPELLDWYGRVKHSRGMPWRKDFNASLSTEEETQRAYEVLVSEIMLQQTQMFVFRDPPLACSITS